MFKLKEMCRILMIIFMAVGICISITNFFPVELSADANQIYDAGLDDCIGPPGQCRIPMYQPK